MHLNVGDLHPKSICDVRPLRKYSTLYLLTNNSEVPTNASAVLTFIDLSWPNENFGRSSENVLRTKASGDVWSPGHIPKKGNPLDLLRCQTINTLQLRGQKWSCKHFFWFKIDLNWRQWPNESCMLQHCTCKRQTYVRFRESGHFLAFVTLQFP